VDTCTRNVLSVTSGIGGIELALHAALAGRTRTVCYVENELGVASILAARMEDGSLDPAPIWSDLRTFDPEPWRGKVDILAGGFPCQPHSVAGSQLGADDPRELSGEVLRIADGLGLPDLFLENVPGILRFYWESIRPELREMGYEIEEGLFTASETGAPHRRERLFILAHAEEYGVQEPRPTNQPKGKHASTTPISNGEALAHAERNDAWRGGYELGGTPPANQGTGNQRQRLRPDSGDGDYELAHAAERLIQEQGRKSEGRAGLASTGQELAEPRLPLYPPGPNDHAGWAYLLSVMPQVEPTFCRDADGAPTGVDRRLRAIGNGVVPAVAARAYIQLSEAMRRRRNHG